MKKLLLFLFSALLMLPATAREFSYTYEGQTLVYTVLSEDDMTVSLRSPSTEINGAVKIPSAVINEGKVYTVTEIGNEAFHYHSSQYSGLTSVEIPNTVTKIGNYAFTYCDKLKSVTIPNSVTEIGDGAFCECYGLVFIQLPENLTKINPLVFGSCFSLKSIYIPNTVEEIGRSAFYYCGLTSVTIPNSVLIIHENAFFGTDLSSIRIGESVARIGSRAFYNDSENWYCLSEIYYNSPNPVEASYDVFFDYEYDHNSHLVLYVPEEAVERCKEIDPWKNFQNIQAYDFNAGIEAVATDIDENSPCEVYNLGGAKINDSTEGLVPGIYLVRRDGKVNKIVIR